MISALVQCTKNVMTSEASMMHYSECMQTMEESVANNTDAFSVICHQYDIEGEAMLSCNVVTAIVNGVEMVIDPNDPSNWHTPKNEREYLRSPQKAGGMAHGRVTWVACGLVWGIGLRRLGCGCGRRLVTGSCVYLRDDPDGLSAV